MPTQTKNIELPKGFEETNLYYGPSYKEGEEILFKYCKNCKTESKCEITKILRHAMGENYPFWSDSFITVKVERPYLEEISQHDGRFTKKVMCNEYKSQQPTLPKMKNYLFSDGVERLIDITEKEKQDKPLKEV